MQPSDPPSPPPADAEFLLALGRRVRETRERRGLSRKRVAQEAAVSERHLAHLESGEGNVSIVLLRHVAAALEVSLSELLAGEEADSAEQRLIRGFLERLPRQRLEDVVFRLMRDFGDQESVRRERIALLGLRGAGKTTLGRRLAHELGVPFVELEREIERDSGMGMREIFSLYGQSGYRRIELQSLERVLREQPRAVLAVGGGIVSQAEAYERLLASCFTVWLKTSAEEHMARVSAQGDSRSMAGNDEAMADLSRILEAREPLYRKADTTLDTSGESVEASLARLKQLVTS